MRWGAWDDCERVGTPHAPACQHLAGSTLLFGTAGRLRSPTPFPTPYSSRLPLGLRSAPLLATPQHSAIAIEYEGSTFLLMYVCFALVLVDLGCYLPCWIIGLGPATRSGGPLPPSTPRRLFLVGGHGDTKGAARAARRTREKLLQIQRIFNFGNRLTMVRCHDWSRSWLSVGHLVRKQSRARHLSAVPHARPGHRGMVTSHRSSVPSAIRQHPLTCT